MISGGVVGWEKAEDVPCSCLCIMSLYFAYKMIMLGSDTTREVRAGCVGDTSIIITSNQILYRKVSIYIRKYLSLQLSCWFIFYCSD